MEILFNRLFKIDVDSQEAIKEEFQEHDNLDKYILELLEKVTEEEGDRVYKFEESSTTTRSILEEMIDDGDTDSLSERLAKRLLQEETDAQNKYGHITEILKGMLIISYVKMTENENKIIISKADYYTFIEEISGEIKNGLPLKKRIFKAFIANVSRGSITKLITYDQNAKVSQYWWKEFLELDPITNDEDNTKNAFDAIEKTILNPIRKKSRPDYLHLWNATVAYFRTEGEFDMSHYRDEIIGDYKPYNDDLDIETIRRKCDSLPEKKKFDKRFEKVPEVVDKNFKKTIVLTKEIELVLKHDIANIKKTIRPFKDVDGKYIMIRSDEGYEFARKKENDE